MTLKGIPTFRILDEDEAKRFYNDFLGFTTDWESRAAPDQPLYMQVSRDGLVLHLADSSRFQTGSVVYVETTEIDALNRELKARNAATPDIIVSPWGTRQMEIEDPFGNWLRFNELTEI